jgi:hypothetical protein
MVAGRFGLYHNVYRELNMPLHTRRTRNTNKRSYAVGALSCNQTIAELSAKSTPGYLYYLFSKPLGALSNIRIVGSFPSRAISQGTVLAVRRVLSKGSQLNYITPLSNWVITEWMHEARRISGWFDSQDVARTPVD